MGNLKTWLFKYPILLNLLFAAVLTCGLIYAVLKWLDIYTHHNEAVIVPDVKGLQIEQAAEFFKNNGLRYNVIDSVFAKEVTPGAIVEVVPSAGSKVKEGRIVFVTVNAMTSQMGTIPEVTDLSLRQAYALLKANGFERVETEYVPGEYRDLAIGVERNGRVLNAAELVPLNSTLVLKVSSGRTAEEMLQDSLDLLAPVEIVDSEVENWF
ncbi:MAG: PASTA domain-containing protein [Tannerellaceae bacterium]|nr:PASTA domain-containing protein [Tannerellaceae bacterium]MCC8197758.1 PASTA domain-containing protein [Tannerellaceae bacterium]MCD7916085.1 PASTA domain-containing protein [Tannerellaceae bacterium]